MISLQQSITDRQQQGEGMESSKLRAYKSLTAKRKKNFQRKPFADWDFGTIENKKKRCRVVSEAISFPLPDSFSMLLSNVWLKEKVFSLFFLFFPLR